MLPDISITKLKGVGEKRAGQLKQLGVDSIDALFHYFPRAYEDWSKTVPIMGAELYEKACLQVVVKDSVRTFRAKSGIWVFETQVFDTTGLCQVLIFNNRYSAQLFQKGKELLLYGKVTVEHGVRKLLNPAVAVNQEKQRIKPVYRRSKDITSNYLEGCMERALQEYASLLEDPIPESIRQKYHLMPLRLAIEEIHFPSSMEQMKQARNRLIFEELLELQVGLRRLHSRTETVSGVRLLQDYSADFYQLLPFTPTNAQKRAVAAAMEDMQSGALMNRLLQGDVGSGKTMVAAALCYSVIRNGYQCALMAPTEILAEQHFATMQKFFQGTGMQVSLLTGSTGAKEKADRKAALRSGATDLVVGTHALLTEDVDFARLGLVITDEQHRFGVNQRGSLAGKGEGAHVLVMSATPIPRTMALAIYGDLDVSIIDELPKGRQPIETYRITGKIRPRAYRYIKKFLDEGRQAYIVCPLVEEGEDTPEQLVSATEYYERIRTHEFQDYAVGLLHGQMKNADKEAVMERFVRGDIQLLVATTVIEVGVDVPNAVIMLIENAERFGLSQLHQLRGRVGRGPYQSTCILLSDSTSDNTRDRLQVLCSTNDGFEISQKDLALRGPGDFFGQRQHGLPELRIADMLMDFSVLEQAGVAAEELLQADPALSLPEHQLLSQEIDLLFQRNQSTC